MQGGWGETQESRRASLIAEAHKHVHFLEDGFDSTYTQLHAALQRWIKKGVDASDITNAFRAASGKKPFPVKPQGFVKYVTECVQTAHLERVEAIKADEALPDGRAARPSPQPAYFQPPAEWS